MNWGILGHTWAVHLLGRHLAAQRVRHAYLFSGPDGIGRRTLALRFAQALTCPNPPAPGEGCQTCRSCQQVEKMQHPDLTILEPASPGEAIKVDQVRELQRGLALAPYQSPYRVALLLDFDQANPSASNALLKTLEEPPSQVILILTSQSLEGLLPTVVSRCEVVRLRPPGTALVTTWLQEQHQASPEQAALLAHLTGGRPGAALAWLQQSDLLDQRQAWLDEHKNLLTSSLAARFGYAEKLSKDKNTLRQALQIWASYWRDILLETSGSQAALANQDRKAEIASLAGQLSPTVACSVVQQIEYTRDLLAGNINPRLATEVLVMDLPKLTAYD